MLCKPSNAAAAAPSRNWNGGPEAKARRRGGGSGARSHGTGRYWAAIIANEASSFGQSACGCALVSRNAPCVRFLHLLLLWEGAVGKKRDGDAVDTTILNQPPCPGKARPGYSALPQMKHLQAKPKDADK